MIGSSSRLMRVSNETVEFADQKQVQERENLEMMYKEYGRLSKYNDDLKERLFYLWYRAGKPLAQKFVASIVPKDDPEINQITFNTIQRWISDFKVRSAELDLAAKKQLDEVVVAERVQMLRRHSEIGRSMQQLALDYFKEHEEEITGPVALRLLVEGVRIERDSSGIPDAIGKVTQMSDEELLKELQKIISDSPVVEVLPGTVD